ncbi:thio(seleno)oxazole modification radical SAM maturase SbtM [Thermodesulfobacteriota bacterium]
MTASAEKKLADIFPTIKTIIGTDKWQRIMDTMAGEVKPENFTTHLKEYLGESDLPSYLTGLSTLELIIHHLSTTNYDFSPPEERPAVNPSLQVVETTWQNLVRIIQSPESAGKPGQGSEVVLIWQDPVKKQVKTRPAADDDLLALKMVVESISPQEAAEQGGITVTLIDRCLEKARRDGIILVPGSKIKRDRTRFQNLPEQDTDYLTAEVFTLQWHVTQACDLNCKHCYDRSSRGHFSLERAYGIVDELRSFCDQKSVAGQISFTGGNPLLYPDFVELYRYAADKGFMLAVLGNPASENQIKELCSIQKPEFFQVSLEGLKPHSDEIRGTGHFDRVLEFLDILNKNDVYSMVMLTLTNDNIEQVIPLVAELENRANLFTFNRLSLVGEGARLKPAPVEGYRSFLEKYLAAAGKSQVAGLKDNLLNIIKHERGMDVFGGCAGFGCGAAFNFMALLADGEVHACRKFPSLIGNVAQQSLMDIYDSEIAQRYRRGSAACDPCSLKPVCGGCLAVVSSNGLDPFTGRDPYCFSKTS